MLFVGVGFPEACRRWRKGGWEGENNDRHSPHPSCVVIWESGSSALVRQGGGGDTGTPTWQQSLHYDIQEEREGGNTKLNVKARYRLCLPNWMGHLCVNSLINEWQMSLRVRANSSIWEITEPSPSHCVNFQTLESLTKSKSALGKRHSMVDQLANHQAT